MIAYIVYATHDPYELPLAVLDNLTQVANFIGCSRRQLTRTLNLDYYGYTVEVVNID